METPLLPRETIYIYLYVLPLSPYEHIVILETPPLHREIIWTHIRENSSYLGVLWGKGDNDDKTRLEPDDHLLIVLELGRCSLSSIVAVIRSPHVHE